MKHSTKLLLSIVSIFILTIGITGLVYGFGEKDGRPAPTQSRSYTAEQTKSDDHAAQTAEIKDENDKPTTQESNETEHVDVASSSESDSKEGNSSSKNSTGTLKQKPIEKKNTAQPLKQEETNQQTTNDTTANNEQKKDNTEKPNETNEKPTPALSKVSYSILADKETGTILPSTAVEIKEGDTVMDVLIRTTRDKGIPMSFRGGTGATAYVEGINNLFEFDKGQGSGWMYRVNGIFPNKSAGVVPLLNGDRIEWLYTLDLGKDLGAELQPFR